MATYRFSFPTPIHFGGGVRKMLGKHLAEQGKKKPMVVTDRGVAALPMLGEITGILKEAGLQPTVFSEIWGNPVKSQVMAGVKAYKDAKCDSIVGLGGGAALDVAKAIALMIDHTGDLFQYEDDLPGALPFHPEKIPYFVALPTTSGTGSEVGRSAVVSDDQTHIKKIIFHPCLLAKTVFADPELTFGLPAGVTASTGFDALTHCVEAYLAKGYHPIADGIALEGTKLAAQNLVKACKNPKDLDARSGMMMSSMMGAIAFQKGLGVTHSCAHALGTVTDMHHGLANAVMIDFALKLNMKAVPERFKSLAQAVGAKEQTPEGFLSWLAQLKKDCGIPANLTAAGVKKDKLDALVDVAIKDACHGNNPCPVTQDDFRKIFNEAF